MIQTFTKSAGLPVQPPSLGWWGRHKRTIKTILLVLTFLTSLGGSFIWWFWDAPLMSPVNSFTTFRFLQNSSTPASGDKVIYGFVPYWNLKKTTVQPELTHLSYFSLTIGGDGSLLTKVDGEVDQGYHRLQSEEFLDLAEQALNQNSKVDIVLTQFNESDINSFLKSKPAQEKLIAGLDNVLLAYPVSGVNIDIECAGSSCQSVQDNLTEFMIILRNHLDTKYDQVTLSIDVYASAPKGTNIWNVAAIEPYVDYFIIMAYDFHRKSSPQAGPIAPLFGGAEYWDSDISGHLQDFLKAAPSNKLLLGIPFYGYQWQTVSKEPQSHTFPDTGSTASIELVDSLMLNKTDLNAEEHWNESALSPYIT